MPAVLTRTLKEGMVGDDVRAVRRACLKFNGEPASPLTTDQQRTFGPGMQQLVKRAQDQAVMSKTGVVGPKLMAALRRAQAFDAYGIRLLEQYAKEHPKKPKLIEPNQGFKSLDKSLWEAYSIGRRAGLSDLGTYNPASTLPGGGKSDHAVYPAMAFDLGVDPDTGYANPAGRRVFDKLTGRPEIEYVILGDKIWSVSRGLHAYTAGGHLNHLHASGVR